MRWVCDPRAFSFESTEQVEPARGVTGQDEAVEALRFALETRAPGQNVFVRGLVGTGRGSLVRQLVEEMKVTCPVSSDRCYVHDFSRPDRPRLITLPPGQGHAFRRRMERLIQFIRSDLGGALDSEAVRAARSLLEQQAQQRLNLVVKPFEQALQQAGLALAAVQVGQVAQPVIVPLIAGQPVPPEALEQARLAGQVTPQQLETFESQRARFKDQLQAVAARAHEIRRGYEEEVRRLLEDQTRALLAPFVREIEQEFPFEPVRKFLLQVADSVVELRLWQADPEDDFTDLYRVNVLLAHEEGEGACAVVEETAPTTGNLLGRVDRTVAAEGRVSSSHMTIVAGSILRADQGFLLLEAREVLAEPGAWKALIRSLKSGKVEITPPDFAVPLWPSLSPEPIDVSVKVVLIGDYDIFVLLDERDPDFPHLFKVLADFDSTIPRDESGIGLYAGVLSRIARDEGLLPFDRSAVGALTEHGARIAARAGRLTARFGRVADIAREGAHLAARAGRASVSGADVREAVRRNRRRAGLPSRQFRELVSSGTIRLQLRGSAVGQINGLAMMQAGPLTYGFPARITATIGPGTAGVINIEREAALSGAIHTKGFFLLGGVLRTLLRTDHPLAFNASIAFEQSYGGIDGDSASAAETCCLLSALTEVPLRQDVAMTGAVDQMGNVLSVGAVNEKVEGFFDTCRELDPGGTCAVIIPQANAGDLMLREDLVDAAREGRMAVYPVSTVHEALEILTGIPAGTRDEAGRYPKGSLLATAMEQAVKYWRRASGADAAPPSE